MNRQWWGHSNFIFFKVVLWPTAGRNNRRNYLKLNGKNADVYDFEEISTHVYLGVSVPEGKEVEYINNSHMSWRAISKNRTTRIEIRVWV